jgi:hypothetical protein
MLPCANQLQQRCHHHQHRPLQQQLTPTHSSHHAAARRAHTAARAQTTTSTTAAPLDQQAVAAAIPQPPPDYEYKSDILPETLEVVQQQYPQLLGLVQAGVTDTTKAPTPTLATAAVAHHCTTPNLFTD